MIIKSREREIHVEKEGLIKNSNFFKDLFAFSKEEEITIESFSPKYIESYISYILTKQIPSFEYYQMIKFYRVADYFGEKSLIKVLTDIIIYGDYGDYNNSRTLDYYEGYIDEDEETRMKCVYRYIVRSKEPIWSDLFEVMTSDQKYSFHELQRCIGIIIKMVRQNTDFPEFRRNEITKHISFIKSTYHSSRNKPYYQYGNSLFLDELISFQSDRGPGKISNEEEYSYIKDRFPGFSFCDHRYTERMRRFICGNLIGKEDHGNSGTKCAYCENFEMRLQGFSGISKFL